MAPGLLGLAMLVALQTGAPDSAGTHRRARDSQAEFERYRRAHLPIATFAGGRLAVRVGRFTFWQRDGDFHPPAEPARVRAARERLLAELDTAAAAFPSDGWITGQLVRYLIEHDSAGRAAMVARRCAAARWWCLALEGLARHVAGDFAGAEDAFQRTLATMPHEQRCRWSDASLLLDGRFGARYRRLPCAQREALDERLWWLARPLYLIPGNDRRTEHLARMTMVEIHRDASNAHGVRWGNDMAEIMVRYGWETAWSREWPRAGAMEDPGIVGYERSPGFRFLPAPDALAEPFAAADSDWDLQPVAPRDAYAPAYADSFVTLPYQITAFRRGDSTLVLAAYDASADRRFAGGSVEAALVLSGGPQSETVIVRSGRPRATLAATIGPGAALVGLEVLSRAARRVMRVRSPLLPAAAGVATSDLVLLEATDSLPGGLDQALPLVLGSTDLGARRRVVVFWEIYGLQPGDPVNITLAVRRTAAGMLRRAARALRLARRSDPVRIAWSESPLSDGLVASRSLLLDLSALAPGRYRIELTVAAAQQGPVTVARDITLGKTSGERASRE